jgi:hypothetical protein
VTQQHYIGRSEAKDAQVDCAMRVLAGEHP